MRPSSAKAKGRRAQQEAAKKLVDATAGFLEPDDIRSTSMGAPGADLLMSPLAKKVYPFDVEVKNVEALNIWKAIEQAKGHGPNNPMVCFTKNNEEMYVAIKLEDLLKLYNYNWNPGITSDILSNRTKD